ncbi:MAG: DNA repair protein RecN [Fimbriimonadaceae bacterium]|jgi:DNA repair protein RecN (Recombination protein N)|nr:DNA repair protein RecN [Fimbriimonadaceae bacterium]
MILELTVENLAIIDRAELRFDGGFTALTGETGAGKSLLLDSIGLALGGRADSDLVRTGTAKAVVTLQADLRANPLALAKCAELGVDVESGSLIIQREVSCEGRSTVRLNGKLAPVGTLKEIGNLLVDLHGQHDHQALLDEDRQRVFLDAWIGEEAQALLASVSESFERVEGLKRKINNLRNSQRELVQRVDMLEFQVGEILEAGLKIGESEFLEQKLNRLRYSERIGVAVRAALAGVSDDEGAAQERLRHALKEVEGAASFDDSLQETLELWREAVVLVEEAVRSLRHYEDQIENDPAALEETAARLDLIGKLKRKYGDNEEAILAYLATAEEELATLVDDSQNLDSLTSQLVAEESILKEACDALTELRMQRASVFAPSVLAHVRELAMEKAEFFVRFDRKALSADGQDLVSFDFTANPGELPKPLSKVASGGELSRVMLAIKVASAGLAGVPTLIFDEVDTGLSGRAAAVTAKKLGELARHAQVIVISHLPQIAGKATAHYKIEKVETDGRVLTIVRGLSGEDRVYELARLLAGEQVGASALANARELLQEQDTCWGSGEQTPRKKI